MVGGKYQWLIMGTYGPTWWNEKGAPCPVEHLSAALDGCILTDYLPLSTTGEITVSGIVSYYFHSLFKNIIQYTGKHSDS